jgi:hypothetical protein
MLSAKGMKMTRFGAIFPIVLMMLTGAAFADPQPAESSVQAGTLHGDYYFYTFGKKDGRPVCAERWRFGDDGMETVFSGDEVVTQHFRIEQRETYNTLSKKNISQSWLIITGTNSNGKADCLGQANNTYKPERGMILYKASDGGIATAVPFNTFSIKPFGHIYPAADVDAKTGGNAPVK